MTTFFKGDAIGKLTLVEHIREINDKNGNYAYYWKAVCECGNVVKRNHSYFYYSKRSGRIISCGCQKVISQRENGSKLKTGFVIGEFTLVKVIKRNDENSLKSRWLVKCSCGIEKEYSAGTLYAYQSYSVVSCGCKGQNTKEKSDNIEKNKPSGTIDDFMTLPESSARWHVSGDSIKDRIRQRLKNGKMEELIKDGLIKPPYNKGGPWIISKMLMETWYGQESQEAEEEELHDETN